MKNSGLRNNMSILYQNYHYLLTFYHLILLIYKLLCHPKFQPTRKIKIVDNNIFYPC